MEVNVVIDGEVFIWIFIISNYVVKKKIVLENVGVKVFVISGEKYINLYEMFDVLG